MPKRPDIRNIAIVAHVDHGKTTLVDAMLSHAGLLAQKHSVPTQAKSESRQDSNANTAMNQGESQRERVMDSNDLEREKGITILAKNTSITYHLANQEHLKQTEALDHAIGQGAKPQDMVYTINIVDTPGHADFSGEVQRALSMVDAVVLLVDASEGPLPQTRFVLQKSLELGLKLVLVINKTDRQDARIEEVVQESIDLILAVAQDLINQGVDIDEEELLDLAIVYASAKNKASSLECPNNGEIPAGDMTALFETIIDKIPAPDYESSSLLRAQVTNIGSNPFLGRLALVRIHSGELRKGQTVCWYTPARGEEEEKLVPVRIVEILKTFGLKEKPVEVAQYADIVQVAGISDITIGDCLLDLDDPKPLGKINLDEPAISMTIGINTSPLVGQEEVKGKRSKVTAPLLKARLDLETVGNVSLRVLATDNPNVWEIQGRGELAFAILIEQMRREGYEFTVGKPKVLTEVIEGVTYEPLESLSIDIPEASLGALTKLLAKRKAKLKQMTSLATGWMRLDYEITSRGLIGFRSRFLSETHGAGIYSSIACGLTPWVGDIASRNSGSLICDRSGTVTNYAILQLQARGEIIVESGSAVYEGQIIGFSNRPDDLVVNITREKKQTNIRSSTAETFEAITPVRTLSLEECLESLQPDECLEVTPSKLRLRKNLLDKNLRAKAKRTG